MFQGRNRPSLTAWEDRKPMIEQLYLEQNRTLEEVSAILAEDDFHATIRQYKTRLKSWGYDNKKIRADVWKAMAFGLSFFKRHNQQAVFSVPVRGGQVKEVGQELIGKQMRRTTGYFKDLSAVLDILATNKVDISCMDLTTGKKTRYVHPDYAGIEVLSPRIRASAVGMQLVLDVATRASPAAGTATGTQMSILSSISGLEPSLTSPSSVAWTLSTTSSSKHTRSLNGLYNADSPGPERQLASHSTDEFDIMSAFGQLYFDQSCSPVMREALWNYVGSIFPITPGNTLLDEEKRMATQWTAYYILTLGPEENVVHSVRDEDRACAMNVFRELLIHHSRYIYPFCSSVIMVLGSEPPDKRLEEFLNDCCEVIDNHMKGQEMNYGSPFHVARALWLRDAAEINFYEKSFARSTENIGFIWGKDSPNYVVNQHYYAWLKLHKKDHTEAISLLQDLLPKSQQILGEKHPLTINCYATLSRAQAELQNFGLAIDCLRKALELLNEHSSLLHKYRDRLSRRLAQLLQNIGNYVDAENVFRQSLAFRLEYFTIESTITWNVIEDIKTVLVLRGLSRDADDFYTDMTNRWRRANYDSYLKKHGSPPDWFCTICQDPTCPQRCSASSSSSMAQS